MTYGHPEPPAAPRRYPTPEDPTFRPITQPPPSSANAASPEGPPRVKPWSPLQTILVTLGFGLVMALLVVLTPDARTYARARLAQVGRAFEPHAAAKEAQDAKEEEPIVTVSDAPPVRADASLRREGKSPIAGGFLSLPPSFASESGDYDLVVHFHGNADLVEESYKLAGINAAVLILNYGIGSGVYEDRFENPAVFSDILARVGQTLERRGLAQPRLRRLALSAWSAGYGAVMRVLERKDALELVDAVLLFDGIHCGYRLGTRELVLERLAPFERFAKQAVQGKKLFSITHSDITPIGDYAGTRETTDALLRLAGVERSPGGEEPPMPALASIEGVLPKKMLRSLRPLSEAQRRGLYVRGYTGTQAEHHTMHLVQMSVTALPDLVAYWRESSSP